MPQEKALERGQTLGLLRPSRTLLPCSPWQAYQGAAPAAVPALSLDGRHGKHALLLARHARSRSALAARAWELADRLPMLPRSRLAHSSSCSHSFHSRKEAAELRKIKHRTEKKMSGFKGGCHGRYDATAMTDALSPHTAENTSSPIRQPGSDVAATRWLAVGSLLR